MRDRLIELLNVDMSGYDGKEHGDYNENLADYLLANGVIAPPCKVGDKIFQVDSAGRIYESVIKRVIFDCGHLAFDERAIGKTIFLTREEAEQALKGGESDA